MTEFTAWTNAKTRAKWTVSIAMDGEISQKVKLSRPAELYKLLKLIPITFNQGWQYGTLRRYGTVRLNFC